MIFLTTAIIALVIGIVFLVVYFVKKDDGCLDVSIAFGVATVIMALFSLI